MPYYGADSRFRVSAMVKRGAVHARPGDCIVPMHQQLRAYRQQQKQKTLNAARQFSTAAAGSGSNSNNNNVFATRDIQSVLTDHLAVNAQGQIVRLSAGVDLCAPPAALLDPAVDHAPKRHTRLTAAEEQQAGWSADWVYFQLA